jgi:signal peptidase I
LLETLVLAVVLFLAINAVSARVRVDGTSMLPTLEDGEFVLVNRLAYRFGEIQRGDIVVFHYPQRPEEELIKRIIGLPDDEVKIIEGSVLINGQRLQELYIAAAPQYSGTWTVPQKAVFVLGDNRNNSSDSHQWGMLPVENVIGRALLIYWPPPMWAVIQHTESFALARQAGRP